MIHLLDTTNPAGTACGKRPGTGVGSGANSSPKHVTCKNCLFFAESVLETRAVVRANRPKKAPARPAASAPFRVLCADPPWKFGDSLPGPGRGASKHYDTLTVSEISRFPLPPLADDAVLILWRVASMLDAAEFVVRAWGFKPKAELVWVKMRKDGKATSLGMGRTVRNCHESAIIATRGRPERLSMSERSVLFAPRGTHSRKPEGAYELVERLYPGPYVELFATQKRLGWVCYGDELGRPAPT